MAQIILKMYADFDREMLAIPVLTGLKPDHEKFAGALYTLTTEALAKDGKAIQVGTSHNLGQGFSEAYDVSFLDENDKPQRPWMTSWGVSTRLIGTLIVVHGDENGLRLPPSVAPIQIVIVPIYKSDKERDEVLKVCQKIEKSFKDIRVKLDDRDDKSPGFKFNEWEVKGVPLRIEVGPKDIKEKQAVVVRRDTGEKETIKQSACTPKELKSRLDAVQKGLLKQAESFMERNTRSVETNEDLINTINKEGGFVWAPWDGSLESAEKIQAKTKATIRLLGEGEREGQALFAKAY
jgi:prolyl-tRNA synthetase